MRSRAQMRMGGMQLLGSMLNVMLAHREAKQRVTGRGLLLQ